MPDTEYTSPSIVSTKTYRNETVQSAEGLSSRRARNWAYVIREIHTTDNVTVATMKGYGTAGGQKNAQELADDATITLNSNITSQLAGGYWLSAMLECRSLSMRRVSTFDPAMLVRGLGGDMKRFGDWRIVFRKADGELFGEDFTTEDAAQREVDRNVKPPRSYTVVSRRPFTGNASLSGLPSYNSGPGSSKYGYVGQTDK